MALINDVTEVRFEHLTRSYFYSEDWPPINEAAQPHQPAKNDSCDY
jgi:hypothetical protein